VSHRSFESSDVQYPETSHRPSLETEANGPAVIARAGFSAAGSVKGRAFRKHASPGGRDALLATFDASVAAARAYLEGLDETSAQASWRMLFGEREVLSLSRIGMMRTLCLNHWYHHRGELVVYLRLLGVPVPVVYGRSADESAFGQPAA